MLQGIRMVSLPLDMLESKGFMTLQRSCVNSMALSLH